MHGLRFLKSVNVFGEKTKGEGTFMAMLGDSWCGIESVESRFGVSKELVLEWVKEGIVRSEDKDGEVFRVNIDDLELKIEENLG